jgi:hypothetical protein
MATSSENATITTTAGINANPPYNSTDVRNFFTSRNITDLCQLKLSNGDSICEGTIFVSIPVILSNPTREIGAATQASAVDADAISFTPQILATPSQAQGAASSEQQAVTMNADVPAASAESSQT